MNHASLIRVFPRKTRLSPDDENVRFDTPTLWDTAEKVHISVAFTYDLKRAEYLYKQWKEVAPTELGGPAVGMIGEEFTPGLYLKAGTTITSRGCNNRCWFCNVWKRDGTIRELEIKDGYDIADDNLLQCSDKHIMEVFAMLKRQEQKAQFSGGLEAKLLKDWHCEQLAELKPRTMYFAYDTPDDYDPLVMAGRKLMKYGFKPTSHQIYCYVLIGYPKDTFDQAEKRMRQTLDAGFLPYAMLYRDKKGDVDKTWRRFQREWSNFHITAFKMKKHYHNKMNQW
jgi:hypothetical protein